ncbi:MAG: flagellar capping protein [Lachnospiraceae bacterium]|nr:flagellar capping protein [Lachnospiraceae bacterium]
MAYNSAVDNVYNHYLTTYAPKSSVSKYDTHKKSELRGIYNSMLKLNKDAPLYLLNSGQDSREFAVNLKENARALRNTIASIGGQDDESLFKQKAAYSTDEGMVSAEFIGEASEDREIPSFTIEVTALASPQVNLGYALSSDEKVSLPTDTYSFDININDLSYEFQFAVRDGDTNKDVQNRLARLITNADVGIEADVLENGKGSSALRLTSTSSGLKAGRDTIFDVSDDKTSKSSGSVEYFGIDYISGQPSNAEFLLSGQPKSASSNHFTIDKQYELTLNGVHKYEGQTAEIGVKTDLESITENVESLIEGYNAFVKGASVYHENHPTSTKLLSEMDRLVSYYKEGLGSLGMNVTGDGSISLDEREFKSAMAKDEDHSSLSTIKNFASSVLRKVNQISLNPMEYVDKTVVAYKNPGHNFTAPYVSSNYSGMLFNSYC